MLNLLEQSLSTGKDLGDRDLLWRSLRRLGGRRDVSRQLRPRPRLGRRRLSRIVKQVGDEDSGMDLHTLGEIESALGNIEKAVKSTTRETLTTGRRLGLKRAVVGGLEGLGKVAFDQGDYARARAFYEEGLQVADELGQKSEFAISLAINLAELAAEEGKFEEARRLCIGSLRNSQEVGDKESITATLSVLCVVVFC